MLAAALSGCGSMNGGGLHGGASAFVPSVAVLKHSAWQAVTDTRTWAPALGAAVFGATNWDRRMSDWAMEQQPLFGSRQGAMNAGDDLRNLTTVGALVTSLTASNVDTSTVQRLAVQTGAHFAALGTAWTLKHGVSRRRPDGSDTQSFPSGHSTAAFADATLAQRNIATLQLSPLARQGLDAGFDTLAVTTAWSRLEAGEHYPSDVLAGAAIGHFMAAFVNDAFLGAADRGRLQLGFLPSRHGSLLEFSLAY